jgi:hypothetical protein
LKRTGISSVWARWRTKADLPVPGGPYRQRVMNVIHSKVSGVDRDIVAALFEDLEFNLSLDQALLVDLENQARWLLRRGYTEKKRVPDYLERIYPDALYQIKSTAVTLIK